MTLPDQFLGEGKSLKVIRLRLEQLGYHQDSHLNIRSGFWIKAEVSETCHYV
jgi:hypothetical protein